jgi:hypothetical protein
VEEVKMTSFHLCFKGKREAEIKFQIERIKLEKKKIVKNSKTKTRPRPFEYIYTAHCLRESTG